jgi:DNA-binding transcriptional ArsR family regulator
MKEAPQDQTGDSDADTARDPLQPQLCAKRLAALAAPERLKIVRFLRGGPRNVGEIADMLQTAAVNVSHHLNVMKVAGLVSSRKQGRFVLYSLVPGVLEMDGTQDHLNLGCCRLELPVKLEVRRKSKKPHRDDQS